MHDVMLPSALCILLTGAALAAQAPTAPTRQEPVATFKSGVEVVTVSISVRDDDGKVIKDLTKADFELFDSGYRREIKDFFVGDSPITWRCCSISAAAWPSAATWTGRAMQSRSRR
jgi:ATP-dependent helicase YprA (DUF1998 family)